MYNLNTKEAFEILLEGKNIADEKGYIYKLFPYSSSINDKNAIIVYPSENKEAYFISISEFLKLNYNKFNEYFNLNKKIKKNYLDLNPLISSENGTITVEKGASMGCSTDPTRYKTYKFILNENTCIKKRTNIYETMLCNIKDLCKYEDKKYSVTIHFDKIE